jgi:predicted HicB family RNase H-like nuclease
MIAMHYKGYYARIEIDDDDGILVGHIAGINDVVGFHADNVVGLRTAFHEAVDDYVAACQKIGKPAERSFSGNMMFRVDPALHAKAALAAELAGKSLNQWGEDAIAEAVERATTPLERARATKNARSETPPANRRKSKAS